MLPPLTGTRKQVRWAESVRSDISERFGEWARLISAGDAQMNEGLDTFVHILLRSQKDANYWLDVRWILDIDSPGNADIGKWITEARHGAQHPVRRITETGSQAESTPAVH